MNRERKEGESYADYRKDQVIKEKFLKYYLKRGRIFHESCKPVTSQNPDTGQHVTVIERTGGTYRKPKEVLQ